MEPYPTFINLPPEKKDNIFRVALYEFAEKGYQGASINAMVKRLGIAKGSMYQYFKDKDALFIFVFSRAMETVIDHLRSIRTQSKDHRLALRLKLVLHQGVNFIEDNPEVYTLYVALLHDKAMPMREEFLKELRVQSVQYIRDFLEDAEKNEELRPSLDMTKASFLIESVMDRFLLSRTLPHISPSTEIFNGDDKTITQWIDSIIDMLCKGVIYDG